MRGTQVTGWERRLSERARTVGTALVMAALAAVPRLVTATGSFRTQDEFLWELRSTGFHQSVTSGNFAEASALTGANEQATMPGVTTMWAGTFAHMVRDAGRRLGLWSATSMPEVVTVARILIALATAALIGVIVLLLTAWVGRPAAFLTGALLATEPFLVAHSALLHTDALMTFSGLGALIAVALLLGIPHRTAWAGRPAMAAVAGTMWGLAWLTKVSAVMFLPAFALLGLWAAVRHGAHMRLIVSG